MDYKLIVSVLVSALIAVGIIQVMPTKVVTETIVGAISNPDIQGYLNVHGKFEQGGKVTTATPTSATYTFTFADMSESSILTFVASTTMPALTATLPATTTFPLSGEAGARRTWLLVNPFTAAATTTTVAAGTGVDLQEPDGQNVVIGITNYAWITCHRLLSTDITCNIDETIPAD